MKVASGDLSDWLNGKTAITLQRAGSIADILQVSLSDLLSTDWVPSIPAPVVTSHDVVNFLRKALNDTHAREAMIKAMGEMAWDKGEFGLSAVKRTLVERLPSLNDSQAEYFLSLIDVELTGVLPPDEVSGDHILKPRKNKAK